MTAPQPLPEPTGQLVRVHYQEGRTAWWWAHYTDATVQPDEIGVVIGRTADRNFENYHVRLLGRPHDVTFAATELSSCDLAAENAALRAQAETGLREEAPLIQAAAFALQDASLCYHHQAYEEEHIRQRPENAANRKQQASHATAINVRLLDLHDRLTAEPTQARGK